MFSALKKRLTRQDDSKSSPFPSGVGAIGQAMQTKFAKGVQYNMKIIIRGERNSGKSCLLARLQGKPFTEAYIPTQEIQAASINWNYRGGDDIVKVEVWDIVDKGQRKKPTQNTLKISNESSQSEEDGIALDAEFVDVYKGTHGVIMILDITKPWTWKYVERELPKVPNHIPVLVMANFRDMGEHRLVDSETMSAHVEHLERPVGSAEVNFVESSLKNGFGLRYLYQFLNIPFLILQRETLLRQLEANALEIEETREKLLHDDEKEEQNYDKFIQSIASRKAKTTGTATPSSETDESASETSPSISAADALSRKIADETSLTEHPVAPLPPANVRQSALLTENKVANGRNYSARVEKLEQGSSLDDDVISPTSLNNIHEFSPESDLDPNFLDMAEKKKRWWNKKEAKKSAEPPPPAAISDEEESDDDGGNPLVMDYQDLDSDDEKPLGDESHSVPPKTVESDSEDDVIDNIDDVIDRIDDVTHDVIGTQEQSDGESDKDNPLVSAPADIESSDEETEIGKTAPVRKTSNEAPVLLNEENGNDRINNTNNLPKNISSDDNSSNDENDAGPTYEITPDFDIDDDSGLNNWLGGGDGKSKQRTAASKPNTKENDSTIPSSKDSSTKTENNLDRAVSVDAGQSTFAITADDLDMFMTEQMRKTSISHDNDDSEKKPRKKKERKPAEGEKKKKKKPSKDREGKEDIDHEKKKKKPRDKEGKKKKSSKRTTDSEKDYELL